MRDSTDAARRRETKIALFKLERSLQNALDDYRSRARDRAGGSGKARIPSLGVGSSGADQGQDAPGEAYYDLLILSRGTSGGAAGVNSAVAEDSDEEDNNETRVSATFGAAGGDGSSVGQPASLRQYLLLLLNLHGLRAASSLQSCRMELELLRSMPASAEADAREREGQEREEIARRERARAGAGGAEADWRLDGGSWGARADGALMDARGRPLRPFTITSSSAPGPAAGSDSLTGAATITQLNARQRVREEVFRAGHRLPTMSIDDFLEEEERRGNIITGGG